MALSPSWTLDYNFDPDFSIMATTTQTEKDTLAAMEFDRWMRDKLRSHEGELLSERM